jgi:hypothetical protein
MCYPDELHGVGRDGAIGWPERKTRGPGTVGTRADWHGWGDNGHGQEGEREGWAG